MKMKLTRMIAVVLAMLLAFSCVACDSPAVPDKPTQGDTVPVTEPEDLPTQPSATKPNEPDRPSEPQGPDLPSEPQEPDLPDEPEIPTYPEAPAEPETPDEPAPPAEQEKPAEPKPDKPVVKNEFFNDKNYEMEEGKIAVKPRHVYWENGNLVAECFVINGDSYIVHDVHVAHLVLETQDGKMIAEAYFDEYHEDQTRYGDYFVQTFTFTADDIKLPNADLQNIVVKPGINWQHMCNEYCNQEIVLYPWFEGTLPEGDKAFQEKKVDVRVRVAYWQDDVMSIRLSVANGTDTAITNVDVSKLTFTNENGLIASATVGILKDEYQQKITIQPGRFLDVDVFIPVQNSNNELINAQWDIQFTSAIEQPVEPEDPFGNATDEQILASLENRRVGRMPMNDDPRYTYLSETRVVGALVDCEYDIAEVEVLYATVNGARCTVYQTYKTEKINELLDSEEWDAETFGCREIQNIFLVESEEPIEITDDRTDYVIVEHHIMFRVYLTNGEYRDVLYGSDNYVLEIFGGGMMSQPEWYM